MRSILAATALLAAVGGFTSIGTAPAEARDYPWCSRSPTSGFNPSCSFTSYRQCMATVSGQPGDCVQNPLLAYGEQRAPRRKGRIHGQQQNDWDNGWNNNGWNQRW